MELWTLFLSFLLSGEGERERELYDECPSPLPPLFLVAMWHTYRVPNLLSGRKCPTNTQSIEIAMRHID